MSVSSSLCPQTLTRGSAPAPRWGTSVPRPSHLPPYRITCPPLPLPYESVLESGSAHYYNVYWTIPE